MNQFPWAEVAAAAVARAERRLDRVAVAPVAPEELAQYVDGPFTYGPGLKPFLVRAVKLNPTHGTFVLRFDGRDLYVAHASLGRRPLPMLRQPLIVALPAEPANVYVECGMDE